MAAILRVWPPASNAGGLSRSFQFSVGTGERRPHPHLTLHLLKTENFTLGSQHYAIEHYSGMIETQICRKQYPRGTQ
jgi:hypothetical protein